MLKPNRKQTVRLVLVAILCLTAINTYAKFWGNESTPIGGISGSPDGSQCFQLMSVQKYVFWIPVGDPVIKPEPVPYPAGQGLPSSNPD